MAHSLFLLLSTSLFYTFPVISSVFFCVYLSLHSPQLSPWGTGNLPVAAGTCQSPCILNQLADPMLRLLPT